jgi:hypothetical protein
MLSSFLTVRVPITFLFSFLADGLPNSSRPNNVSTFLHFSLSIPNRPNFFLRQHFFLSSLPMGCPATLDPTTFLPFFLADRLPSSNRSNNCCWGKDVLGFLGFSKELGGDVLGFLRFLPSTPPVSSLLPPRLLQRSLSLQKPKGKRELLEQRKRRVGEDVLQVREEEHR